MSDRGAVAITVAISLLVLIGFAALAMDGGLGFDDRRGTQNAADNAALAAAWEACNPSSNPADPIGSALATAAQNGYDDTTPETSVSVTQVSSAEFEVVIETTNDSAFAGAAVGSESVSVTSRAIAHCKKEPFLGGYAIFAGAETCPTGGAVELSLTGSTKEINGGIFSNGDLTINGSNATINGPVEYRGTFNSNAGVVGEQYFGSPKDYPVEMEIGWFDSGGLYADPDPGKNSGTEQIDNDWMVDNGFADPNPGNSITIKQSGIYFSGYTGNQDAIRLTNVDTRPNVEVAFVSEGTIFVNGAGDITGRRLPVAGGYSPLLFFSTAPGSQTCQENAIQFSGSDLTWTGLVFAPNGEVQMSSASAANTTFNGSIIAYSVSVSGSNFVISWQDDPSADPRFIVELEE